MLRAAAHAFWPVAAVLALNPLVALLEPGTPDAARERARALVAAERDLGLWVEPHATGWLADRPALLVAASAFYLLAHVPVAVGALVWLRLERPDAFARARRAFVLTQLLLVCGYVLVPTAPPRLLPELALADPVTAALGGSGATAATSLQTPWAAMPSGHVAWAVLAALLVGGHVRSWAVRATAAAYAAAMWAVTIATGHHLWLDGAVACLVVAVALSAAGRVRAPRRRSAPRRPGRRARRTATAP